jgi:hypothetical protein
VKDEAMAHGGSQLPAGARYGWPLEALLELLELPRQILDLLVLSELLLPLDALESLVFVRSAATKVDSLSSKMSMLQTASCREI